MLLLGFGTDCGTYSLKKNIYIYIYIYIYIKDIRKIIPGIKMLRSPSASSQFIEFNKSWNLSKSA